MELKKYQRRVIRDLRSYLEELREKQDAAEAYRSYWALRGVRVGGAKMPAYVDSVAGAPHVCFKVPTGGGKTFLACNAIKPIFDAADFTKVKTVVWLVPSDAILEQTIKTLTDTGHPYRQKIDVDFGGRVEVYTKAQLLAGQNFNPTSIYEQLSIFVLSYDSFRAGKKEGRKAYQENSSLVPLAEALGEPEAPVEGADETALIQVINQLHPLVIVDESHHAKSTLSLEMLNNFNPCFVLDLTATPAKNSNVISYVDAVQLKAENMVKLPVIVYNRSSKEDVLVDAIDFRQNLEDAAARDARAAEEDPQGEEFLDFDDGKIEELLETHKADGGSARLAAVEALAQEEAFAYERKAKTAQDDSSFEYFFASLAQGYPMKSEFREIAGALVIPQFYKAIEGNLFCESQEAPLTQAHLLQGFSLRGKDSQIDFKSIDFDMYKLDVMKGGAVSTQKLMGRDSAYIRQCFSGRSPESKVLWICRSRHRGGRGISPLLLTQPHRPLPLSRLWNPADVGWNFGPRGAPEGELGLRRPAVFVGNAVELG